MKEHRKCIFCLHDAEPKSEWEIPWSIRCAESLQRLLDLEPFTSSFFEAAEYCRNCKGVMRDVDFMSRSISALEGRLSKSRQHIAKMLLDNFEGWRPTSELECEAEDDSRRDATSVLTVLNTSGEDLPPNYYIKPEESEQDSVVDTCRYPNQPSPPSPSKQERLDYGVGLSKMPLVPSTSGIGCASTEELEEYGMDQLVDDDGVGHSGKFICDFPGCNKRFLRIYPLDCHKPTHMGWRAYKCTDSHCSATFIRKQHLVRHINRAHRKPNHSTRKVTDKDDEPIREEPNDSDYVIPPEQELPVVTEESEGVDVGQTEESTGRRSLRLASRPQKRPLPIEEEESDQEGRESDKSDFRVSSDGSESEQDDEKDEEEGFANKRSKKKTKNPTKVARIETRSEGLARFKCQNERLIPFLLRNNPGVCREVGEDASKAGESPSWDSLLGTLESPQSINIPEETFEATFCFLFKKALEDAEKGKRYGCTVSGCHRGFGKYADCARHALEIHGQLLDSFQCFLCDSRFPAGVHLDSHISKTHGGEMHPFLCPVPLCSTQHKYKFKLSEHMAARHPEFQYDEENRERRLFKHRERKRKKTNMETLHCAEEGCTYRTLYPKYMKAHRIKSHGQDQGSLPYECETCGARFKLLTTYKQHRIHAHLHPDEKLVCEFCGASYAQRYQLSTHIRWKHFDVATKFNCKVCTRPYFNREDCGAHEALHTKVPPFSCVLLCGPKMRQCRSLDELVRHVQSFHDERKKIVCDVCGYAVSGKCVSGKFKIHMRSHTREKTYKCRFCPKIFLHESEKSTHVQIKHQDETKKEYKCGECGEVFGVYQYYYRHRRNKHGSNPIPPFKRKKVTTEQL